MTKMKTNKDFESVAIKKGRKASVIVHTIMLGLLVFPFLQMTPIQEPKDIHIVMDFRSGSSNEGMSNNETTKAKPKSVVPKKKKAKKVATTKMEEPVKAPEPEPIPEPIAKPETQPDVTKAKQHGEKVDDTVNKGVGAGDKGNGDAKEGSSASGNGKGFIEGTGVLSRAVIDRGNTKELAHKNGTLILKICINKRGIVTYAEWDKEKSSIKDSKIARQALDNVLNYRFEKDYNAPSKECGRLTYIFKVN